MRFTAKIENGKINWHDTKGLAEHLNLIDSEEVYIDIKPSKVRNTAQNNYYWSILREFGEQCGYHAEEMFRLFPWLCGCMRRILHCSGCGNAFL